MVSIIGGSTILAETSTAKGSGAWATEIAGIRLSYGSTKTVANPRATGDS